MENYGIDGKRSVGRPIEDAMRLLRVSRPYTYREEEEQEKNNN